MINLSKPKSDDVSAFDNSISVGEIQIPKHSKSKDSCTTIRSTH